MVDVEEVFRALADPSRRTLLDALFDRDGQTLGELGEALPAMTRFGVAKHLRVLEVAGLVVTRRAGRSKLHYLNPVPIRLVHDRWISKYAEPWVRTMSELKTSLEAAEADVEVEVGAPAATIAAGSVCHEIYVRATPEQARAALDPSGALVEFNVAGPATRIVVTDDRAERPVDWAKALSAVKTLLETGEALELGAA